MLFIHLDFIKSLILYSLDQENEQKIRIRIEKMGYVGP